MKFKANTKEYDNYRKAYNTGALFEIEGFTLISKKVHVQLDQENWQAVYELGNNKEVITLSDIDIRLDVRENLLKELEKIRVLFQIFTDDDKTPSMIENLSNEFIRARKHLRDVEGHYMARDGHFDYLPY